MATPSARAAGLVPEGKEVDTWRKRIVELFQAFPRGVAHDAWYVVVYVSEHLAIHIGRISWYFTLVCGVIPLSALIGAFAGALAVEVPRYLLSIADIPKWVYWTAGIIGGSVGPLIVIGNLPSLTYAEMRESTLSPIVRENLKFGGWGEFAVLAAIFATGTALGASALIHAGSEQLQRMGVDLPTFVIPMIIGTVAVLAGIGAVLWMRFMVSGER